MRDRAMCPTEWMVSARGSPTKGLDPSHTWSDGVQTSLMGANPSCDDGYDAMNGVGASATSALGFSSERLVGKQAERMPLGVEHDSNTLLRLVVGEGGALSDRPCHAELQVGHA